MFGQGPDYVENFHLLLIIGIFLCQEQLHRLLDNLWTIVKKVLMSVYVISGITAGLAGLMFASRVRSGQVTAGVGYELDAITAVILGGTSLFGGRGRIFGTLVGALLIGVLSNGLVLLGVPIYTQLMIKGAVIILAVAIDTLRSKT